MKWIGQNIHDFISRFRNDVYLESISSGTIASGAHLGLDSNNKIVKASDGGGDLTAIVAGTGLSGSSLSGPIPTLNVDAAQTQITSVGTIGTGVWEGTAIASAYLDADTSHMSTQRHMTHHGFTADMDTTKQYVGLIDADSENTATTNGDLPQVFPTAGKLLKVFLRAHQNLSAKTLTWRLETQAVGVSAGTGPSIVGTQSGAGCTQLNMATYDFTSSLDSGDNLIDAGDMVFLSVESDSLTTNTKYYITCLWEVDLS